MRLITLLISLLLLSSSFASAQIPSLTAQQWIQNAQHFADEIRAHHRDPYHLISKMHFDSEVAALKARIPSMKDYVVGLQRVAALIGDGHTFIDTSKLYHQLPIEVFWFGNDLRVVACRT